MPDLTPLFATYFKTDDVRPGPVTLTIESVEMEDFGGRDGEKKERKPVLYFREDHRGLVMNKTKNSDATQIFGNPLTESWLGKKVQLVFDPTVTGPRGRGGIALRAPK